jgi:hypothetical protein
MPTTHPASGFSTFPIPIPLCHVVAITLHAKISRVTRFPIAALSFNYVAGPTPARSVTLTDEDPSLMFINLLKRMWNLIPGATTIYGPVWLYPREILTIPATFILHDEW